MSELFEVTIKLEDETYCSFLGVWEKEGDIIRDVSSQDFEFKLNPEEDICNGIIRSQRYLCCNKELTHTDIELFAKKINKKRGVYHPRIFRPIFSGSTNDFHIVQNRDYGNRHKYEELIKRHPSNKSFYYNLPIDKSHLYKSLDQLASLVEMMKKIFRTVYPSIDNEIAYGFDIRNLILLACTEFENQIKGILDANNIQSISNHYTTKDYIRIKSKLRLNQYVIAFRYYPDLPFINPFNGWNSESPTKSLFWYDSYNRIKHDRDNSFNEGTLKVLIHSISACFVILLAQYGELKEIKEISSSFWTVIQKPDQLIPNSDLYYVPSNMNNWIKANFEIN